MKKKLEAELISIAHRILQMKNKDDVHQLHHEAQKLYEKLSVLVFIEENFDEVKPTIGIQEIGEKLERAFDFDEKIVVAELKDEYEGIPVKEKKTKTKPEPVVPTVNEEIDFEETRTTDDNTKNEIVTQPVVEADIQTEAEPEIALEKEPEAIAEEPVAIIDIPKPEKKQISFDDLLSSVQPEPIFERVTETKQEEIIPETITKIMEDKIEEVKPVIEEIKPVVNEFIPDFKEITFEKAEEKPVANLNDKMSKSAGLTLNDRVAFEKNLFDGSTEDLNRVISQIATFDNFEDAKNFIDEMVKPDYNDWKGKEEFSSRFMEFVESKFA